MTTDYARARTLEMLSFDVFVERGRLRAFAAAVGETDPVHVEVEPARAAGHRDVLMMPTYLFSLEPETPEPFGYLTALGADLRGVPHGEQSFAHHLPLRDGDTSRSCRGPLMPTQRRPDGPRRQAHRVPAWTRAGRHGRDAGRGSRGDGVIVVGDALPPLAVAPISRPALALFAGASGNHNPIHIDLDVARSAGVDDVFCHGMLSMAYLSRMLTGWIPPGDRP